MSDQIIWKKGRGTLGLFKPLLGSWVCQTQTDRGPLVCTRSFQPKLNNKYIELVVDWNFANTLYAEYCLFGVDAQKNLTFWSFTNDGKQSQGQVYDVSDIHPHAIGFAAQMPAGFARQFYWPSESTGFHWAVESKNKKGWNRFVSHHYLPQENTYT
ncbi:MAG: hypothetical protein ACSHWU_06720 [Marinicella sp.]